MMLHVDVKEQARASELEEKFFLLLSLDRDDPHFLELYQEVHEAIDAAIIHEELRD